MAKIRLDVLMVQRALTETREKAKRLIMAGLVFSNHERMDKPGIKVSPDIPLTVKGKDIPYVGRGGLKLETALATFDIDIRQKVMVDVGSSTGGFTDCALQNGVKMSYAIDVGYNQLAWSLRQDDRVVVMERTNFRHVTPEMFGECRPNFATIDVSFISLRLILPVLKQILESSSDVVALIKPQFEAGKDQVGKKGIVKDKHIHVEVLERIIQFAIQEGYQFNDLTFSQITGGSGNIEFLAHFRWQQNTETKAINQDQIKEIVDQAHRYFHKQG
ncbi:TlyA family RNA methyltransferase [Lentibacillus saliphilus]|uniref:TlyA family RNA methyltransferase n=1 Tax=Lentibacillus saliphilus TaxID=2737028 RepID=UPI001C2F5799|nr:TlyA family RNA methyltransferase [Lentibacillus saliphilus]